MTIDPRALVQQYYRTVDAGDAEAVVALFTETAVYDRPGYDSFIGRDALLAFFGGERVIASGRHGIELIVVDGDTAAAHGEFSGVLKTGEERSVRYADFFQFDAAGLIDRRRTFFAVSAV